MSRLRSKAKFGAELMIHFARRLAPPRSVADAGGGASERSILAIVDAYLPRTRGGAEQSLHEVLVALSELGHDCRVLVRRGHSQVVLDGVRVETRGSMDWAFIESRPIVFSQLSARMNAAWFALRHRLNLILFQHSGPLTMASRLLRPELFVFNTNWMAERSCYRGHSIVMHPWVNQELFGPTPRDGSATQGQCVLLVNLSSAKGGDIFWRLVDRYPDRRFVGVMGGWGEQIIPSRIPPNAKVFGPLSPESMREVYRSARVILLPSRPSAGWSETYGRVGVEAASLGVPALARDLPGIREALGSGAVYVPLGEDRVEHWGRLIELLDDPVEYRRLSGQAKLQAGVVSMEQELPVLLAVLRSLPR